MTETFEPAQEIVAALQAATTLPREAKAALLAWTTELGPVWGFTWSPFRCLFGFVEWTGSLDAFPPWPGAVVHGVTTHAAGPWQAQPETYGEIAAMTGRPGFNPADQIANMWILGVRDFGHKTNGGDLLAALKAGQFDKVSTALHATWPAGADQGFGARYSAVLALFPETAPPAPPPAPPPPPPPPMPPSPPPPPTHTITLRPGFEESFPIAGTDQDGQPFMPPDALQSDDTKVCTVAIAIGADGAVATIAALGLGQTLVHGADLAIAVRVEAQRLAHLTADFSKAVISRIPAAMAAMAVLVGLAGPAGPPGRSHFALSNETAKSDVAAPPTPPPVRQAESEPSKIGDPEFCLASGNLVAMQRCLAWTAALSSR